jgi:hypothetical protein
VDIAPSAVLFSPSGQNGLSQTFTWTVASPSGNSSLAHVFALFNATSASTVNACYIHYDPVSNLLYLADNASANWLGGFVPGDSSGSASNSQCTISGAGASVSTSGTQLTVTVPVAFQASFSGTQNEYLFALDNSGVYTGWQQMGTWTVPTPETISTPTPPTGAASATVGIGQTYTSGGATSSLSNGVQYLFNWGDASNSGWLPTGIVSASHTWSSAGTYSMSVQARSAANPGITSAISTSSAVTVTPPPPPDFTVTARTRSQSVNAGNAAAYVYDVTAKNGLDGSTIHVANGGVIVPSTPPCLAGWNQSANWNAATQTGTVTLYIETTPVCPSGFTFLPQITWVGGNLTKTTTDTTLIVTSSTGFTISLTPSSQAVTPPGTATYTVVISGFSGTVGFTLSGLPSCASMTSGPGAVTGGGSTTFTIATAGCGPGTSSITVTGSSPGYPNSTATAALVIQGPSSPPLTATPSAITLGPNGIAGYAVTVGANAGFGGTVNFGVAGLPSGASATFSPSTLYNAGTVSLSIATSAASPVGTFPIRITAQSGAVSFSTSVLLTVVSPSPANLLTPATGSILGTTAVFSWDAGYGVSQYQLSLGTSPGGIDIYQANMGTGLSASVSLPAFPQPQPIYATLASLISGTWQSRSYTFRIGSTSTTTPQAAQSAESAYYVYNDGQAQTWSYRINNGADAGYILSDSLTTSCSGLTAKFVRTPSSTTPTDISTFDVSFTASRSTVPGPCNLQLTWKYSSITVPLGLSDAVDVYDATPVITYVQQDPPCPVDGSFYVEIYGKYLGLTKGTLSVCVSGANPCSGTPDLSVNLSSPYSYWSDGQVNALIIPSPNAAGLYDLQIGSLGANGTNFVAAPQSQNSSQSNKSQLSVTQQARINSVTPSIAMIGSTGVQITITGSGFGTSPSVTLPTGISQTQGTQQINSSDGTSVRITIDVTFGATIGNGEVRVKPAGALFSSSSGTFTVNGPSYMKVVNDGIITLSTTDVRRTMQFKVFNFDDTEVGSIPIAEAVTTSNWSCTTPATPPPFSTIACDGTQATAPGDSIFNDMWSLWEGNFTPAGCGLDLSVLWQWCHPAKNGGQPMATFGKLVGFSHTDAVKVNGYTLPPTPMPAGTIIRSDGTTIPPK